MRIADIIERATIDGSSESWEAALQEALNFQKEHGDDPEAHYILGYVYFHFANRSADQSELAQNWLTLCLQKKDDHQLAVYHLGVLYFWEKKYIAALDALNKLRRDFFYSMAQQWRIIKTEEIKLACRLRLGERDLLDEFHAFSNLASALSEPDEMPAFIEIADALNEVLKEKNAVEVHLLNVICGMIITNDQLNLFSSKRGPFYDYLRNNFDK